MEHAPRRAFAVLQHMGQLVGHQTAAIVSARMILAAGEGDVVAEGEGTRMEPLAGPVGGRPVVDTNGREIGAEARLEEGAFGTGERAAGADRTDRLCRSG